MLPRTPRRTAFPSGRISGCPKPAVGQRRRLPQDRGSMDGGYSLGRHIGGVVTCSTRTWNFWGWNLALRKLSGPAEYLHRRGVWSQGVLWIYIRRELGMIRNFLFFPRAQLRGKRAYLSPFSRLVNDTLYPLPELVGRRGDMAREVIAPPRFWNLTNSSTSLYVTLPVGRKAATRGCVLIVADEASGCRLA